MNCPTISVVVPAFNEARVIHRSVGALSPMVEVGAIELIVVANGCSDETAETARRLCPLANVIQIGAASKTQAMNRGAKIAKCGVVVFLDADLRLMPDALRALTDPILAGNAEATCGQMMVLSDNASWLVRAFYRGWALNPYFDNGKFGGVFALSRHLVNRMFPLPAVSSDDEFISRTAAKEGIAYQTEAWFEVHVPRRLSDLIRIRRRSRRGTAALEAQGLTTERLTNAAVMRVILGRALQRPALITDASVYMAVCLWVRAGLYLKRTKASAQWERDESSRQAQLEDADPQLGADVT